MTYLADEAGTIAYAQELLPMLQKARIVTLQGNLGAGKTTLVRGILAAMGYQGLVKSPTYGLVETYELSRRNVAHFDLYRLGHPDELEFIGYSDYLDSKTLCLIEWPEKGEGRIGAPDIEIRLKVSGQGREIETSSNI